MNSLKFKGYHRPQVRAASTVDKMALTAATSAGLVPRVLLVGKVHDVDDLGAAGRLNEEAAFFPYNWFNDHGHLSPV